MQYVVYEFATADEIEQSWLISLLGDYHFDGFEETTSVLKAYAPASLVNTEGVRKLLADNEFTHISFIHYQLEDKNWNEEWEKNFEPVVVAGKVGIRAPFHAAMNCELELIIEPKMSFGTGHHATTASVIEMMLGMNFAGKSVLDFGSGTGVLAILAEKLKAAKIVAIDNEEWAFGNCIENIERNGCVCITPILGDDNYRFTEKFDILLANINRHVILKNLAFWKTLLNSGGELVVSGILLSDEKDIILEAEKNGLVCVDVIRNNGWLAIRFHEKV
ncbi:MAG: 50S ribosomal protein L11 methyltransferase [Chitinophagales bacterium]